MAKKALNEAQLREYVENEVRNALLNESLNEGWLDKILQLFGGGDNSGEGIGAFILNYIKDHWNVPDLISLLIGLLGVAPVVRWLCGVLGIDTSGPLARLLVAALSSLGAVTIGDIVQGRRSQASNTPAVGAGGDASAAGGE